MPFDPNASFGKSLFFGEILEDQILPFPRMPRDQAELVQPICETIDRYMAGIETRKLDRAGEFPPELLQSLKEMGLFGVIVPEEHGGLGLSNTGYARVMQQIASWDGSIAVTLGAHSSIGFKGLLLFGREEQKRRYLPKLATGEMIAGFCLTEPGSGSDAFSIKTSARREGDFYVLNGQKLWITNGGIADFYTVFAKTTPDAPEKKGSISAFIVTRDLGGITHGPHEDNKWHPAIRTGQPGLLSLSSMPPPGVAFTFTIFNLIAPTRLVRGPVAEGGSDRLHRLLDAPTAPLLSRRSVADLNQIRTIAGNKAGAVARWAVTRHDDGGLECLQPVETLEPLPEARMRARKGRLSAHGEIAGKQNALGLDPDDRIAGRMVWAHGNELRLYPAEVEIVVALECNVGLAEICVLQQFGINCGTAGKYFGELQAELGDVLHLVGRANQRGRGRKGLGAEVVLGVNVGGDKIEQLPCQPVSLPPRTPLRHWAAQSGVDHKDGTVADDVADVGHRGHAVVRDDVDAGGNLAETLHPDDWRRRRLRHERGRCSREHQCSGDDFE